MEIQTIPQDIFIQDGQDPSSDKIAILLYHTNSPSPKTRITLTKNLFSFLLDGEKTIHYSGKTIRIDPNQFLLLAGSNCLMSEKLSTNGRYSSLLLFFDDALLTDFFLKYGSMIRRISARTNRTKEPVVCFHKDPFILNYLHSLQLMLEPATRSIAPGITAATPIPPEMQLLKFEELMLYLAEKYPENLLSFQVGKQADLTDQQLKNTVESNLHSHISVEELAFLCYTSLSTFKRRFARLYGTSPNKWILQKRMELAATLLHHHQAKPSEVYYKVGYENHSSFTHSFKQAFGLTPSEFQQQKTGHSIGEPVPE